MIDFSRYAPQKMFLVQGNEKVFDAIIEALIAVDPMVQGLSVPRLTIEHARSVAEFAVEGTGEERTQVIYFSAFSPEAAQVLLKSLEEPAPQTTIVFITRYPYLVPHTVRSRLMIVEMPQKKEAYRKQKDIIQEIKKESAEKDDDAATRRSRALALLDELEGASAGNIHHSEAIYRAKQMLFKANLPTKYVLDYLTTVVR
ncbi:MAG TPA: hypothetical protein VG982_02790 [Candidatus Paceibacterota bacterium]|jgi:hypothetical protein|nr:hypothetical protein [Candidatus Paceibacterota bacterium]